ncbi:MAG: hypothetical protein ACPGLV_11890 [Bacteroidia bacterium]
MVKNRIYIVVYLLVAAFMASCNSAPKPNRSITHRFHPPVNANANYNIVNGKEVESGLIAEGDWLIVKQTCTACHSAKLVTQNRADKDGWKKMIKWMQETQGLWQLGDKEGKIINYLATHYAPENTGRRKPLQIEEWYEIK